VAVHVAAETRSFQRAAVLLERVLGRSLSAKTIERLAHEIGGELAQQRGAGWGDDQNVIPPEVAVASCDGGRIHTRAAGRGPGVHEARWRESKNASFERMTAPPASARDPCPLLPQTFRHVAHVANIAGKAAFDVECPAAQRPRYESCRRILRTCVSSLASSGEFGQQMACEAQRRRFHEAPRRVFIGDGLPWNWSIWKEHFADFTPILDFIHAVEYLYAAAEAWEDEDAARWSRYLELAEAVWQGQTGAVIDSLRAALGERGVALDQSLQEDHPLAPIAIAARYLENNRERMDYPRYRREGLPLTSAPMESLIKQVNHRVKGSEMFWNDPAGAEAILQLRSASVSEDDRLARHLRRRPGHPYTRRTTAIPA
jgi:hypothetical protein